MRLRLIESSKLSSDVNMSRNGCLSTCPDWQAAQPEFNRNRLQFGTTQMETSGIYIYIYITHIYIFIFFNYFFF